MGQVVHLFAIQKKPLSPISPVITDYYNNREELHQNALAYSDALLLAGAYLAERMYQLPPECLARVFIENELRTIAYLLMPLSLGLH